LVIKTIYNDKTNYEYMILNKDENIHRFALRARTGELLEIEGERVREIHTIWRGKLR
jgi:hypothetical protein